MKLAIFGGSFNPPHRGHRLAAEAFCKAVAPDHLLIVPAGVAPHKAMDLRCSNGERLEMTRLNFASLAVAHSVSDMELRREGKSYTLDTLLEIQRAHPDAELFLYCGSDMLVSFHTWHEYQRILSLCTLCVMKREEKVPGWDEAIERLNREASFPLRVIDAPVWEESSSHIREQLRKGLLPAGLLPSVAQYIQRKGLYQ